MTRKAIFNWSGGKDSALALYYALQDQYFHIERLLTNVNSTFGRVSMHGVREVLLEQQASSIGIPLHKLQLPEQPSMEEYNTMMKQTMTGFAQEGFAHAFFGDIFLEDLKKYREDRLAQIGFTAHFPIWQRDTTDLIREFLDLGFKTILVCVKSELLDKSFAGRVIDEDFLKDLPKGIDSCGEHGEFHTFVFDGPIFQQPIAFNVGETVYREYRAPQTAHTNDPCQPGSHKKAASMGFWFCDLIPVHL